MNRGPVQPSRTLRRELRLVREGLTLACLSIGVGSVPLDENVFVRTLIERLDGVKSISPEDERKVMDALAEHISLADLDRMYPEAAARAKTDVEYRDRARKATAELQGGRLGYRLLWKHFVNVSRVALEREFHALGVDFDLWKGESDVDTLIEPMVKELDAKGLVVEDPPERLRQGAGNDAGSRSHLQNAALRHVAQTRGHVLRVGLEEQRTEILFVDDRDGARKGGIGGAHRPLHREREK